MSLFIQHQIWLFHFLGEKQVTFEEFIPHFHTMSKKPSGDPFERFLECFKIFDRENNGMVSVAEVRHLLTSLGMLLEFY